MPRTRSRAYPAISLPEAIGRVEKLYEVAAQKPVSRDQAFHGLGFAGANGVSVGVVSAVRKYGLVEKTGQVYRVSRLAVRLIDGKSASDRQTALEEAVKRPNIFAELWGAFRGQDPSPDDLAAYLAGSGFSPTAIPKVVSGFRSSIDFVRHGGRLSAGEKTGSGQGGPIGTEPFRVSITGDRVEVAGTLVEVGEVDRLVAALEAAKRALPRSPKARAASRGSKG